MEAPKEIYVCIDIFRQLHAHEDDDFSTTAAKHKYIRADLAELTWEDIRKINDLMVEIANKFRHTEVFTEKFYKEVLRRFNEQKKK